MGVEQRLPGGGRAEVAARRPGGAHRLRPRALPRQPALVLGTGEGHVATVHEHDRGDRHHARAGDGEQRLEVPLAHDVRPVDVRDVLAGHGHHLRGGPSHAVALESDREPPRSLVKEQ